MCLCVVVLKAGSLHHECRMREPKATLSVERAIYIELEWRLLQLQSYAQLKPGICLNRHLVYVFQLDLEMK